MSSSVWELLIRIKVEDNSNDNLMILSKKRSTIFVIHNFNCRGLTQFRKKRVDLSSWNLEWKRWKSQTTYAQEFKGGSRLFLNGNYVQLQLFTTVLIVQS